VTQLELVLLVVIAASGGMLGLYIAASRLKGAAKKNKTLFPLSLRSWTVIGLSVFTATMLGILSLPFGSSSLMLLSLSLLTLADVFRRRSSFD